MQSLATTTGWRRSILSARGDAWAPTFASTVSAAAGHRGSWPRESAWSRCSSGFLKARGEPQASRRWFASSRRSTSSPTSYSSRGNSSATRSDAPRRNLCRWRRSGVRGSCSSRRCGSERPERSAAFTTGGHLGATQLRRRRSLFSGPRVNKNSTPTSTRTQHLHQQPRVVEFVRQRAVVVNSLDKGPWEALSTTPSRSKSATFGTRVDFGVLSY